MGIVLPPGFWEVAEPPRVLAEATRASELYPEVFPTANPMQEPFAMCDFAYDTSTDQLAVSVASNIFIGTIVEQPRTEHIQSGVDQIYTYYRVDVEEVLVGTVSGTVDVMHSGGIDPYTGNAVLCDGQTMLVSGKTYLFLTAVNNWLSAYELSIPGRSAIPLSDESSEVIKDRYRKMIEKR